MALDPRDPNVEWAVLGKQIEDLFAEPIGKYLVERASIERTAALEALVKVDPTNATQVLALQLKARVAEKALDWLIEAVNVGQQAEEQIEAERRAAQLAGAGA